MSPRTALCIALCTLLTTSVWADSPIGAVSAVGVVWTNDAALPSGSRVWDGDTLKTDDSGLATVSDSAIGRVEVRPGSQATFWRDSVELVRGVVASQRLPVVVDRYRVVAGSGSTESWFVTSNRDGELLVAAYRGDVLIRSQDAEPLLVPQGQYALRAALPQAPARRTGAAKTERQGGRRDDKRPRRRTGGAKGAGGRSGWRLGKLGHATSVAIVTGLTAAAMTGLVSLNGSGEEAVSPE